MNPRMNKLTIALRGAFGVGMAAAFLVQPAFAQQTAQRSEKIEVTGTNIKRVDAEGPVPVQIMTKDQIQRTGATNTNELMKHISTIDIFDQGELASNSPAGSGTATIRMRGFGENNVLVLLNGRRLPINALYDSSGAGAAVNINMIPIAAIERVEILKDGGSAIYGADAVTGVVNFITKKDYRGAEVSATYGQASRGDGEEKQLAMAPSKLQEFINAVRITYEKLSHEGEIPVMLTSPGIRPYVRSVIERFRPQTIVMSQNEIHPKARIKTLGQV